MLRALIFDFDGLIVDTESSSLSAVQEAYRRHGHDLRSEQWRQCVGTTVDPYDHLQRLVGPHVDLTTVREEMEVRHRADAARLGPRPGVVELVAEAVAVGLRLAGGLFVVAALGRGSSGAHRRTAGVPRHPLPRRRATDQAGAGRLSGRA